MNKFILSGMMALGLAMASGQEAKAWVNFKFGVGLNWHWQSGGNNFLWGLARGGQVPGPEAFGYPGGGFHPGMGHGQEFPFSTSAVPVAPAAPAVASPAAPSATPAQQAYWYGGNPYHTVGFSPSYYTPNYYAPSYWYGR